ncbi:MAG: carbohydrate ABC transporter permease [Ruminococcaceae bacterium]|nr:carbohydrate ABC transporter permease [Oscillospiraceae bacterium]HHV32143.1 carbohydrate ABC transporter permease [Clostridiales bacterium]
MVILLIMGLTCLLPFIFVIAASLSSPEELIKYNFILWPKGFTLDSYKYVLCSTDSVARSLVVSVSMTILGTIINLAFTSFMAYPLSHSNLFGYKVIMKLVTITLVFGGGMIPTYLIISAYGMLDSFSSVLIPGAVSAYNLIVFVSFFRSLPKELEEAAKIDGCNDLGIFFKIILPLSTPLLATFTLMFAVGHWNSWFDYVLYINDGAKWPVQVILRNILASSNSAIGDTLMMGDDYVPPQDVVRYCVIVVATLPILVIYPFLQKYFTKGLTLGSVKG